MADPERFDADPETPQKIGSGSDFKTNTDPAPDKDSKTFSKQF